MTLWQSAARRMMGLDAKPVIEADPKDRRFRDDAWKDNDVFDFIKQSYLLSARFVQDVVTPGRRPRRRTPRRRWISTRASSSTR